MFSSTLNSSSNGKPHFSDLNNTQLSNIGTPLDQSTPAFLFGKRKNPTPSTFNNSPLNAASAPCSDIFAYPAQSHATQNIKDTSIGGSKSVHWSPALVQSEKTDASQSFQSQAAPSTTSISHQTKSLAPPSFAGQAINAPPLRSLRDKIEPAKKLARRNTFAARSGGNPISTPTTPRISQLVTNSNEQPARNEADAADTWVTVFGFQPNQVSTLLNLFSRHGEVVSHQNPGKGNFIHVRYSCITHAQQALSRNGTFFDQETLIGVVPCTNKDVINGSAGGIVARTANTTSANRSMTMYNSLIEDDGADQSINQPTSHNENVFNNSILNTSQFDANTSLNSSRMSVRSSIGMRPLAAERANGSSQNRKQDGLLNKLWNTMGLN